MKMELEKIIEVATVFDAEPEELKHSRIPDYVPYEVCAFGNIDQRETFVSFVSGRNKGSRQEYDAYITVYPDTSSDWTTRIPILAQKLAHECGGRMQGDDIETVVLPGTPTQAQVADWVRKCSTYFDDGKFCINRVRYRDIPASLRCKSLFGERLRTNVQ